MRFVGAVGKMLGLEAHGRARAVLTPTLSCKPVEPVSGIKLHARLCGIYGHYDSRPGRICFGSKCVFAGEFFYQYIIMVISPSETQLFEVIIDTLSQSYGV